MVCLQGACKRSVYKVCAQGVCTRSVYKVCVYKVYEAYQVYIQSSTHCTGVQVYNVYQVYEFMS
jgi:hypothetical protein